MYQPKESFKEHEARVWDGEEQWEIKSGEKRHKTQLQQDLFWEVYNQQDYALSHGNAHAVKRPL